MQLEKQTPTNSSVLSKQRVWRDIVSILAMLAIGVILYAVPALA